MLIPENLTSMERLEYIAANGNQIRSEAAKRCILKREERERLMASGFSHKIACVIVNEMEF